MLLLDNIFVEPGLPKSTASITSFFGSSGITISSASNKKPEQSVSSLEIAEN